MEILGIGASELIFILIIAIIVLGPRDMQKAGRTIGRWLNQLVRSDGWKAMQRASQEIKKLPTNLMREANMELQDLKDIDQEVRRTIDPRQPPSAARSATSQNPSAESRANLPLSNTTDAARKPPAGTSTDANTDTEQDD